jgi:hypothetical protein
MPSPTLNASSIPPCSRSPPSSQGASQNTALHENKEDDPEYPAKASLGSVSFTEGKDDRDEEYRSRSSSVSSAEALGIHVSGAVVKANIRLIGGF